MLILLNKPFGVLCQFTDTHTPPRPTLAVYVREPHVYPAGRLDFDSEGLVLLTDDGVLAQRCTDPRHNTSKTYLLQIEGVPTEKALSKLRSGIDLNDGLTLPAQVELLAKAPGWLWPRRPPIRERRAIPTHWLRLTISEGRNRQVRRMSAAIGLPTLRLIRMRIGDHELGDLKPGQTRIVIS